MSNSAIIGVDVGGTKTQAVLVDASAGDGGLISSIKLGGANYQACGRKEATGILGEARARLYELADKNDLRVEATCLGLAGLDRPRDEEILSGIIDDAGFSRGKLLPVNDAYLALRAGACADITAEANRGQGAAVIAGTGSNCVAMGPSLERLRIGGLCYELGDFGSAEDIGVAAMRAAIRGEDGRSKGTSLGGLFKDSLGLQRLDDFVDLLGADAEESFSPGALAPIVFEAAAAGDIISQQILRDAGQELARSVLVMLQQAFPGGNQDAIPVILGGSVLQKGSSDFMRDALQDSVREQWPQTIFKRLQAPPVLGAALLALDMLTKKSARPIEHFEKHLAEQLTQHEEQQQ